MENKNKEPIQLELDFKKRNESKSKKNRISEEKESLIKKVSAFQLDTIQARVAWLLNNFPETRNSDITLQIKYWSHFDSDIFDGAFLNVKDLYTLTRLTSIVRARATIQNTYKLFLADEAIREYRGVLEKEEEEKVKQENLFPKTYAVYADESGKNEPYLIVGSVWCLNPSEAFKIILQILEFMEENDFHEEFHFSDIDKLNLGIYMKFADFIKERNTFLSFKAITLETSGIRDEQDTLIKLYYFLLRWGIEHENDSGRAPLPRTIIFWKDLEEPGFDKLLMAEVEDRLSKAESTVFENKLRCGTFKPVDSREDHFIQIADLFSSSLNRKINVNVERFSKKPKDIFANHFLESLGIALSSKVVKNTGDLAVNIYM